jgi:hypothetical protein
VTALFILLFVGITLFAAPWIDQRLANARQSRRELDRVGGVVRPTRPQSPHFTRDPSPTPRFGRVADRDRNEVA